MNKYDTFAKRLHIFDIKNWFSNYFTSQKLIDVDFYKKRNLIRCSNCRVNFHNLVLKFYKSYHNLDCSLVEEIKFEIELTKLQSHIQTKAKILTIELIKQKKTQLTEQKIQKQTQRDVELTKCQIKWKTKKQTELIEQKVQQKIIEISKSTSISVDIDIFDSTLICDILKFDLYNKMIDFLQNFQQIQHQYLKSNVFDLLSKCFRNFAFAWFKNQSNFIIIQDFDRCLTYAFSIISFESIAKLSIFSSVSSIFSATSTSISKSISSECSHLSIATFNITSKSMKKISINCSFTFSTSSFRTSVLKHQKVYFTIDDLIHMFREKFKSFDLRQNQKRRFFSQKFDVRSYQSRIIVYFLFAINQKTSINQNLKSSNSKNFQQHTLAKSISFCRFVLSEKSIFSSYKNLNIFYISLQSRFSSRFSFAWFRFTFSFASSFTFSSFFRFRISDHVCCICFDHFNFRNDLFNYSNSNQSYLSNRRPMREEKDD